MHESSFYKNQINSLEPRAFYIQGPPRKNIPLPLAFLRKSNKAERPKFSGYVWNVTEIILTKNSNQIIFCSHVAKV